MVSQRKRIMSVILIVLVASLALSAFAVAAQDSDDDATAPGLRGRLQERFQGRMMDRIGEHPMVTVAAEALGLEADALIEQIQEGATIAEIAEAQGVELQALVDAYMVSASEQVAERVEAGEVSQEWADAWLALREQTLLERLSGDFSFGDFGFGGRQGRMGRGNRGGMFGGRGNFGGMFGGSGT